MRSGTIYVVVKKYFDVDDEFLLSNREDAPVIMRGLINKLSRLFTHESFAQIGKATNKNHATVIHSVRALEEVYMHMRSPFNVEKCFNDLVDILSEEDNQAQDYDYNLINDLKITDAMYNVKAENVLLRQQVKTLKAQMKQPKVVSVHHVDGTREITYDNGDFKIERD